MFITAMSKTVLLADFNYDFQLIGISSHAKDYRLSWEINKMFNTLLSKEKDVVYTDRKGNKAGFSMYFYQDEIEEKEVRLISNKSSGRKLISEQKAVDYFLILYEFDSYEWSEIIRKIRKINVVLTAFEVEVDTLKDKENLLF